MGSLNHHAIVVTNWEERRLQEAHSMAIDMYGDKSALVSQMIRGISNGQVSFFIAPDGSKEGWATSDDCDKLRDKYLDWLMRSDTYCNYVEVSFGGDHHFDYILRTDHIDLDNEENWPPNLPPKMEYITDGKRHLICWPYSIPDLHRMADTLGIRRHWFDNRGINPHPHYDIPKLRKTEIEAKCRIVTPRELLTMIKQGLGNK